MTLTQLDSQQIWRSMPGWGIFADLTPPELVAQRKLRVLRKALVYALAFVLVVCIAGYLFAMQNNSSARSALSQESQRTTDLQRQAGKYGDVVKLQGTIKQIDTQLSQLMKNDVDLDNLLKGVRSALPGTAALSTQNLTLNTTAATKAGASTSQGLDNTGSHPIIGKMELTGLANSFNDVSHYVDNLGRLKGVVDIVPTSSTASSVHAGKTSVQWNMTFTITDQVLSHHFDAGQKGGS